MSEVPKCENCGLRRRAEERPNSLIGRFWRWHTRWCPGWKAYQKWLTEKASGTPETAGSSPKG
jgi:hypothetical protein